VLESD